MALVLKKSTILVDKHKVGGKVIQGSHRIEKYLNIQDCLEKSLKIQFALKST